MENVFEKVVEFIIAERWDYDFKLTGEVSIQNDLKIFGDDAADFLLKFCAKFNVDYGQFRFDDYFFPEPNWIDTMEKSKKYKKFTIDDLVESVKKGKLE